MGMITFPSRTSGRPVAIGMTVLLCAVIGCRERPSSPEPALSGVVAHPHDDQVVPSPFNLQLTDVAGEIHRPFDDPEVRAVALVFVVTDCPIANSYAPEFNRLSADYEARGVRLFLVQVDPDLTVERAREHARDYQQQTPVVLDLKHHWAQQTGVTTTPEVAVLSPAGELLYRGRIDDRYVKLGRRRANVTSHDLREALEAILEGRPVPVTRTVAVGCPLPHLGTKE